MSELKEYKWDVHRKVRLCDIPDQRRKLRQEGTPVLALASATQKADADENEIVKSLILDGDACE